MNGNVECRRKKCDKEKGSSQMTNNTVKIGISARHVHLTKETFELLFGEGMALNNIKDLHQPGEFASAEQVTIESEAGAIERVRILGPFRKYNQVEISKTDARSLKINPPIRTSGDLVGSAPIKIKGPKGEVSLSEGCIIANRHIHFSTAEAEMYGVKNNDKIFVEINSEKGAILKDVYCRVSDIYKLEMHIDTDDANALSLGKEEGLMIFPSKA